MKYDNDDNLLIALQEGSERAFEKIYVKYHKPVYFFVYQNAVSAEEAEELTQDIFLKLWQNSQSTVILSLKNYLFTIARGVVIDYIRKKLNRLALEELAEEHTFVADDTDDMEEKLFREQLLSQIAELAHLLSERQREVYHLRWVEGLSRKEIAERLNISVTTVDIHIRKIIEFMKDKLKPIDS